MASRKFGIAVEHPDGVIGWLIDNRNLKPLIFSTIKAAEEAKAKFLETKKYTWNIPVYVAEYKETT